MTIRSQNIVWIEKGGRVRHIYISALQRARLDEALSR